MPLTSLSHTLPVFSSPFFLLASAFSTPGDVFSLEPPGPVAAGWEQRQQEVVCVTLEVGTETDRAGKKPVVEVAERMAGRQAA